MTTQTKRWLRWLGVNLCRFLLSVTFIFSGVVKLIDPRGTQYKIDDYFVAFGATSLTTYLPPLILAVALALLETYVGFNLFYGIRRRTTTRIALLVLLVLTPVTLYLALTNAVSDCGCFGDALRLTHWQTFGKNVVLLFAAFVVVGNYRRLTRFITERNQWLLWLYTMVFALFLAIYEIRYLPIIDFRPYHIGVDLSQAIMDDLEGKSEEPRYIDFIILTQEGEDITFDWLNQPGYKFLLVAPYVEKADDSTMDKINAVYEYCEKQGYPFLGLTSSIQENIERWKDLTGSEYDFALTDGTVLKTVIRSNPGLLLLHDGTIYQKWSANDMPTLNEQAPPLEELKIGKMQNKSRIRALNRLLLWFLVPILLWTLIDRIWVGRKFYQRHKIHQQIKH